MIKVKSIEGFEPSSERGRVHIEKQEKPITEPWKEVSEDYHGGQEITMSLRNSPNQQSQQDQSRQQNQGGQGSQSGQNERQGKEGQQAEESKERQGSKGQQGDQWEENQQKEQNQGEQGEGHNEHGESQGQSEQEGQESQQENQEQQVESQGNQSQQENRERVVCFEKINSRRLERAFTEFVEKIADEVNAFLPQGGDYYHPVELMLRRYKGKSLDSTKHERHKEGVVVIIDDSGSMTEYAELLSALLGASIQRKDVRVFFAPNGEIIAERTPAGDKIVSADKVIKEIIQNRFKVLYIGDFDGGNLPVYLSKHTQVYWVCTEGRYKNFREHDWMTYDEKEFKGSFVRALDSEALIKALRTMATQSRVWVDDFEEPSNEDFEEGNEEDFEEHLEDGDYK